MVTTRTQLAQQMRVRSNGINRMVSEGTLPEPTGQAGATPFWEDSVLDNWFSHLQPQQSAYAPAKGIGSIEKKLFNVYICPVVQGDPATAGWISSRRPQYLALSLETTSLIQVFKVLWMETQQGIRGETLIRNEGDEYPYKAPWDEVYKVRENSDLPLVYFQLGEDAVGEINLATPFRRGGTINTQSLLDAVEVGYATKFSDGKVMM